MATGSHTYANSTPSSPTAIQNHFLGQIAIPARRDYTLISQFAKNEKITGSSYNIPSFKKLDIPASVERANENDDFQVSRVEFDGKTKSLAQFGHAMELDHTFIRRNLGVIDVLNILEDELRQDMGLRLEKICKSALDEGKLIMTPTGAATQQVDANGTASQAAANNLNVYHFQYLELLASDTYAIPYLNSMGCYAYLTRGGAMFNLLQDSRFIEVHRGLPEYLLKSSVGQIGGIKIFKSPEEELFSSTLGTDQNVSEGVLLGEDCLRMFYTSPFQLKVDMGDTAANFYGQKGYLWYDADLNVTIPTDSVEKRRIRHIRVTSA
jgi:hypothetical protein